MKNKCFRCGSKGEFTWNICADNNKDKWVCLRCDIELNKLVLRFMGFKNWKDKIKKYILGKFL